MKGSQDSFESGRTSRVSQNFGRFFDQRSERFLGELAWGKRAPCGKRAEPAKRTVAEEVKSLVVS